VRHALLGGKQAFSSIAVREWLESGAIFSRGGVFEVSKEVKELGTGRFSSISMV